MENLEIHVSSVVTTTIKVPVIKLSGIVQMGVSRAILDNYVNNVSIWYHEMIFMLPEWRAYSRRSDRPTVRLSVCPPVHYTCPEHISKSIKVDLMKLNTLIDGREKKSRM